MSGFIAGIDRDQTTLFPERLEDWIHQDHLVRVVDLFVDELDLAALGFVRHAPCAGADGVDWDIIRRFCSSSSSTAS